MESKVVAQPVHPPTTAKAGYQSQSHYLTKLTNMIHATTLDSFTTSCTASLSLNTDATTVVYTDGSCLLKVPRAGSGLFYALGDSRNASLPIPPKPKENLDPKNRHGQTNNRAEMFAILAALQRHKGPLQIRSDSQHSVRVVIGQNVATKNLDIVDKVFQQMYEVQRGPFNIVWIKGHDNKLERGTYRDHVGNEMADLYADYTSHKFTDEVMETKIKNRLKALKGRLRAKLKSGEPIPTSPVHTKPAVKTKSTKPKSAKKTKSKYKGKRKR